jgi:crotonobetainyl-CoA:carnitine CoA-transferase CaiB-like acyl-CoA transferase
VLIENFKVGGLKKYKLDYAALKRINPGLVYCSITGFGQTGPYADRAGYDFMIQAMGGMMSVTGEADGLPMKIGVALADVLTGLYAANAIQAALIHQQKTGLATGNSPGRLGNAHPNIVPYQAFQTADGYIILAIGNDAQFERFCDLANCNELVADERFRSNSNRVKYRETLVPQVVQIMLQKSSVEWLDALNERGIPCGPINSVEQVFADPQVQHREMQLELDHPVAGKVASVANPIKLSDTPVEYQQAPPMLGEHTNSVLSSLLGLSDQDLDLLRSRGVIA